MEVSTKELSGLIGVAPDTIERWVLQGKLPVLKTRKGFKFRTDELKKWAKNNHVNLRIDSKTSSRIQTQEKADKAVSLTEAIRNGGVHTHIRGNTVEEVLTHSVNAFTHIPDHCKKDLLACLIEREQALSTGLGNGFAVPHPRTPMDFVETASVSVCFPEVPVDYNALDRKPVSTLFFLLCPDLTHHLHLLSALSHCLKDREFIDLLKSKPEPDRLMRRIEALQQKNLF